MKVLVVSNMYDPVVGGIEVLLSSELIPALRRRGHEVEVLTSTHRLAQDPYEVRDGVPVHRVGFMRALAPRDPMALAKARHHTRKVVEAVAPDVLHAHDPGPILWACNQERRRGRTVPTVLTLQVSVDALVADGRREQVQDHLRDAEWVTAVSDAVVAQAVALEPDIAERVSMVPNAIAVPAAPAPLAAGAPHVLVGLGRFVAQKGFDIAIRAFAQVAAQRPEVRLVLGGDGAERPTLEALARELGVADRVSMPGVIAHREVAGLLQTAAVVLVPSRFEGLPLVALEAAAAGRPIVATGVQGLGDVVVDGQTGLTVGADDVAGLAAAAIRLLDDRDLAARLGAAAHAHVVAHYGIDACARRYEDVYSRVAELA